MCFGGISAAPAGIVDQPNAKNFLRVLHNLITIKRTPFSVQDWIRISMRGSGEEAAGGLGEAPRSPAFQVIVLVSTE